MLEPEIKSFITETTNYGSISFHLAGGGIATHVMWVDADDEHVLINTEVHRLKYRSIKADPRVTVAIWDSANPYYYAEVRGEVVAEVHGPAAFVHINELSAKYFGRPYPNDVESARVILKIRPTRQRARISGAAGD